MFRFFFSLIVSSFMFCYLYEQLQEKRVITTTYNLSTFDSLFWIMLVKNFLGLWLSYLLNESEEGLCACRFYRSCIQAGMVEFFSLLNSFPIWTVVGLWQKQKWKYSLRVFLILFVCFLDCHWMIMPLPCLARGMVIVLRPSVPDYPHTGRWKVWPHSKF